MKITSISYIRTAKEGAHKALAAFPVFMKYYRENPYVLRNIDSLGREIEKSIGGLCFKERIFSKLLPLAAGFTEFKIRHKLFQQPEYLRYVYRAEGEIKRQSTAAMPKNWGTVG